MTALRFDRGQVVRPLAASIFEGVAGRVHSPGDALSYPSGDEHRDADGLASIARQLAGGSIPITIGHPAEMPARTDPNARIVGVVLGARVDGDHAVARMSITDSFALGMIAAGVRELSLGYSVGRLDERRYQREITIDHLAIVERARCGSKCSLLPRSDQKGFCTMCDHSNRPRLDAEATAKLNSRARTASAHISNPNDRADAERRYVAAELDRLDRASVSVAEPQANDLDAELAARSRMAARTRDAWKAGKS